MISWSLAHPPLLLASPSHTRPLFSPVPPCPHTNASRFPPSPFPHTSPDSCLLPQPHPSFPSLLPPFLSSSLFTFLPSICNVLSATLHWECSCCFSLRCKAPSSATRCCSDAPTASSSLVSYGSPLCDMYCTACSSWCSVNDFSGKAHPPAGGKQQ